MSARHETRDFEINSKRTRTSDQRLEYPALLPGTYRFEFGLGKASFAGLREPLQLIEIQPGAEHSIELEAFMGGIVQLKVDAPYPVDGSKSASVHFRRRGTEEWQERLLRTESAKYQMREARVLINGPNAASSAWEAGHYEARVMQPGYETAISSFRIMEEKITFVEITLMPEFDQDG